MVPVVQHAEQRCASSLNRMHITSSYERNNARTLQTNRAMNKRNTMSGSTTIIGRINHRSRGATVDTHAHTHTQLGVVTIVEVDGWSMYSCVIGGPVLTLDYIGACHGQARACIGKPFRLWVLSHLPYILRHINVVALIMHAASVVSWRCDESRVW